MNLFDWFLATLPHTWIKDRTYALFSFVILPVIFFLVFVVLCIPNVLCSVGFAALMWSYLLLLPATIVAALAFAAGWVRGIARILMGLILTGYTAVILYFIFFKRLLEN